MKVLVCPLDWGLGHATRCVPLIQALLAEGHEVSVGATGGGLDLLRAEFPALDVFPFPGYRVRYSRSAAAFLPVMAAQLPAILLGMRSERLRLSALVAGKGYDIVIADGRYGLKLPKTPSIFITHQVGIRIPGRFPARGIAEALLRKLNLAKLGTFDRVWIPDHAGDLSLSGELGRSHDAPANVEWIGPLSRFHADPSRPRTPVDVLAVVSGPEPQRGLFEAALWVELERMPGTRVLVRGLPGAGKGRLAPNGAAAPKAGALTVHDHLPGESLARLFAGAKLVVARSGYTTVMELASLGTAAAVLVPTPGQSEQLYLADHLQSLGAALKREQGDLGLASAAEATRSLPGFRRWRRGADAHADLRAFIASHPLFRKEEAEARFGAIGKTAQQ